VKIYTKTGDGGETGLIDGSRVKKHDPRVAAYGDVDELNAAIGVVLTLVDHDGLRELLVGVQRDLFALGAQLADPTARVGERRKKAAVDAERVSHLEAAIDAAEADLPPLTAFILPGGTPLAAQLQLARGTCRRAERSVTALAAQHAPDPLVLAYLNRLSDLLFVLARQANRKAGVAETKW
jgi:cob(I)alamin adenosyltransferase